MKSLAVTLLLLAFAAAAAHADSADLRLGADSQRTVLSGTTLTLSPSVANFGPDTARNVVLTIKLDGLSGVTLPCVNGTCAIGDIEKGSSYRVPLTVALPIADLTLTFKVSVTSDTPDPSLGNNVQTQTFVVTTALDLDSFLTLPKFVDPGLPFAGTIAILNPSPLTAHNVVTTVDLPPGVVAASLPPECSAASAVVRCTTATLKPPQQYLLTFTAPPRYEGGELLFTIGSTASEKNISPVPQRQVLTTLYRTFRVTNTTDSGEGSLRSAIEASNACSVADLCAIQFNITEPGEHPWKTIRPRSPLPLLKGTGVRIDGSTQSAFSGVANPEGPSIEISGDGVVDGDGLISEGSVEIANLTINGFLRNGLALISPRSSFIHDNFIGTDPTGAVAIPNNRGIGISQGVSNMLRPAEISGNVLSGNVRSGIFALGGDLLIEENRIGLKAHQEEPLPNGGSGIYLDRACGRINVDYNIVAFNREIGIAIDPALRFAHLTRNRIWGNGGLAIDDGLDGPSAAVMTDSGPLAVPVITSAVYDPVTKTTTINVSPNEMLEFFASDASGPSGAGEAQRLVTDFSGFPLRVPRDLRGQWLSATASRFFYSSDPDVYSLYRSSELSRAVQVH